MTEIKMNSSTWLYFYRGFDHSFNGYNLSELCEKNITIEEMIFMYYYDKFPSEEELNLVIQNISLKRVLSDELRSLIKSLPPCHAFQAARQIFLFLSKTQQGEINFESITTFVAIFFPVLIYWYSYHFKNKELEIFTEKNDTIARNFLKLISQIKDNEEPYNDSFEYYLNQCFLLMFEIGFPPSTTSARVIYKNTRLLYPSLIGSLGCFFGNLHGTAGELVLKFLKDVASSQVDLKEKVLQMKQSGEKLFGFGHVIYKTGEFRIHQLRKILDRLIEQKELSEDVKQMVNISRLYEKIAFENYNLSPNIEFFLPLILFILGIPHELIASTTFASRMTGICFHMKEEINDPRLYVVNSHDINFEKSINFIDSKILNDIKKSEVNFFDIFKLEENSFDSLLKDPYFIEKVIKTVLNENIEKENNFAELHLEEKIFIRNPSSIQDLLKFCEGKNSFDILISVLNFLSMSRGIEEIDDDKFLKCLKCLYSSLFFNSKLYMDNYVSNSIAGNFIYLLGLKQDFLPVINILQICFINMSMNVANLLSKMTISFGSDIYSGFIACLLYLKKYFKHQLLFSIYYLFEQDETYFKIFLNSIEETGFNSVLSSDSLYENLKIIKKTFNEYIDSNSELFKNFVELINSKLDQDNFENAEYFEIFSCYFIIPNLLGSFVSMQTQMKNKKPLLISYETPFSRYTPLDKKD